MPVSILWQSIAWAWWYCSCICCVNVGSGAISAGQSSVVSWLSIGHAALYIITRVWLRCYRSHMLQLRTKRSTQSGRHACTGASSLCHSGTSQCEDSTQAKTIGNTRLLHTAVRNSTSNFQQWTSLLWHTFGFTRTMWGSVYSKPQFVICC